MHGVSRRKLSEFGVRLREKQKLRRIYGLRETQFKTYFQRAAKAKGVTGTRLLQLLETRLDNVIYRLGLASSRKEARQIVAHGHIAVNGAAKADGSSRITPTSPTAASMRPGWSRCCWRSPRRTPAWCAS
jgi:small subunit ribosomal protein S4